MERGRFARFGRPFPWAADCYLAISGVKDSNGQMLVYIHAREMKAHADTDVTTEDQSLFA